MPVEYRSHPCPVGGCPATMLGPGLLLCNRHWNMLPTDLRNRAKYDWNDAKPAPEYLYWRKEALAYIAETEGRR